MMNPDPPPRTFLELYSNRESNPWGADYHRRLRTHYSAWNAAGATPLSATELLAEVLLDLGTKPVGAVGVFVKGTGADTPEGGELVLLHSFHMHNGEYGDTNRRKIFAYRGDVSGTRPDCVSVDSALFEVADTVRILKTAEFHQTHLGTTAAGTQLVGPHARNLGNTKEDIKTRKAMFIPFSLVEYVIAAKFSPRTAFEVLRVKMQEQGLLEVCKPLLEFLISAGTRPSDATPPVTLHEKSGTLPDPYEPIAEELRTERLLRFLPALQEGGQAVAPGLGDIGMSMNALTAAVLAGNETTRAANDERRLARERAPAPTTT